MERRWWDWRGDGGIGEEMVGLERMGRTRMCGGLIWEGGGGVGGFGGESPPP